MIPFAVPVGYWDELANELNEIGVLTNYSFSWPHDFAFKLALRLLGSRLNVTLFWNSRYGYLDATYIRDGNEVLELILCASSVKNLPAKIKVYDPAISTILASLLSVIVVLVIKYGFSLSAVVKNNIRQTSLISLIITVPLGLIVGYIANNYSTIYFYIALNYSIISLVIISTLFLPLGLDEKNERGGLLLSLFVIFLFIMTFGISSLSFEHLKTGFQINLILITILSLVYIVLFIIMKDVWKDLRPSTF